MLGRPCIKGTRIPVELLLEKLGAGMSEGELLEAYPHLEREDVLAALRFAADYMADEDILFAEDECLDNRLLVGLRQAGHDVLAARDACPGARANAFGAEAAAFRSDSAPVSWCGCRGAGRGRA
jgi:uncharacterized protein (DUF433 family)